MPQFGYQSVSEQTTNACRDGMLSPGEADIDCGGLCTTACESGRTCNSDSDCASASCSVSETSVCCDYGKTMRISGSMDGKTFTELKTNITGTNSLKITFTDPQYVRYLKLELLEATDQSWWRIDDVIVAQ